MNDRADDPGRALLVLVTAAPEQASVLARALVDERLAACVNVVAGLRSIYRWQQEVEEAGEVLLLIKTTADTFEPLRARIRELHSYDVPEILAIPIADGDSDYLGWLRAQVDG